MIRELMVGGGRLQGLGAVFWGSVGSTSRISLGWRCVGEGDGAAGVTVRRGVWRTVSGCEDAEGQKIALRLTTQWGGLRIPEAILNPNFVFWFTSGHL